MELSYEETMRRIEEYERTNVPYYKCCREKSKECYVDVYKGEKQIIIVPYITTIGYFLSSMGWHRNYPENVSYEILGKTVIEAVEHIKISPVDARTQAEHEESSYLKYTRCKSYASFDREYLHCRIKVEDDGKYVIVGTGHNERIIPYHKNETRTYLPPDTTSAKIGEAVLYVFEDMERFYKNLKNRPAEVEISTFETLEEVRISYEVPDEELYQDEQDYGVGEIYQGYSYTKEGEDESAADMFFGFVAELDLDISEENMRKVFENRDGKIKEMSYEKLQKNSFDKLIYDYKVDIKHAKTRHILYIKQMEEDAYLSCELVLKEKQAGKRLTRKILNDFESMVYSCRVVESEE